MNLWITLLLALSFEALSTEQDVPAEEAEPVLETSGPDRSLPPAITAPTALTLPAPTVHKLTDSATAHYVHVPGVRKVCIDVIMHHGSRDIDGPDALTESIGQLQDIASEQFTPQELSITSDLHEVSITSDINLETTVLSLEVPVDELEKGMEILNDVLKNPSFPKADLKRHIMEQTAFLSEEAPNSSRVLAAAASSYAWYPADSVYGARPDLDGLRKLKTSALQNGYQQLLSSSPISILIVGNVQYADIEPKLLTLVEGLGAAEEHSQAAAFTPPSTQRVIAVDLPGNPQTRIGLRMRGPTFNDPDRLSAQVLNYALGGHFLSRLNTNLREEKGFTYGSRSSYFSDKELGSWVIGVDVATENAAATATEIKYELKRLVDEGVSEAELQMAYTSYTADWNNTMETASNASYAYAARLINQIPITDAREDISKLQGITIEMTKETAAKYLTDDQPSVWVFIGDRKNLEAQLEQFGDKVEWLDRKQVILGNF